MAGNIECVWRTNMIDQCLPVTAWLNRSPEQVSLRVGGLAVSNACLRAQVSRLYSLVAADDAAVWGLHCESSHHFLVALLAVLHAGKEVVLLNGNSIRQTGILQNVDGLISDCLQDMAGIKVVHVRQVLDVPDLNAEPAGLPDIRPDSKLVLFTSGSGGNPKRIEKTVAVMDLEARWIAKRWGPHLGADHVRGSVNHEHLYGLTFLVWLPLSLGLVLDCARIEYPEQLPFDGPYLFITSPAFLQFLDVGLAPPPWSFVVSAGGFLKWEVALKALRWAAVPVHEIYGSTETGVIAHRVRRSEQASWKLFPAARLQSVGDQEFELHSPLLGDAGPFLLEDSFQIHPDGSFDLLGRKDQIIKIGDKRISVTAVEKALLAMPEIADCCVLAMEKNGRVLLGAVVQRDRRADRPGNEYVQGWKLKLKKQLESVAIPRMWRFVDVIPLNNQGKRATVLLKELFDEPG